MQLGAPADGLAIPDRARNEEWKFIPRDGDGYTSEDKTRCFEQQPILVNGQPDDLPLYLNVLCGGCADLEILPPILHFGWRLDASKLMAIVRNHFPNYIAFAASTPIQLTQFIDDEEGKQEAQIDWNVPRKMGECAMTTIFSSYLIDAVQERLQIPAEDHSLFDFLVFTDARGYTGFGLGMGTNVRGVLGMDVQQRVCELFELDIESAQWYVDRNRWYWKNRVPPLVVGPTNPNRRPATSLLEKSVSGSATSSSSS